MRLVGAALWLAALTTSTIAEPAKIAGVVDYNGKCSKFDDDKEGDCAGSVKNIRFLDGYDSIQFKHSGPRPGQELTTAFVGSRWLNNKSGGDAEKLADTMIFMPIEQVVLANGSANQMSKQKYRGQCVLEFKDKDSRKASDLKKIWCEYTDGRSGHAFSLSEMAKVEIPMMKDFSKYD